MVKKINLDQLWEEPHPTSCLGGWITTAVTYFIDFGKCLIESVLHGCYDVLVVVLLHLRKFCRHLLTIVLFQTYKTLFPLQIKKYYFWRMSWCIFFMQWQWLSAWCQISKRIKNYHKSITVMLYAGLEKPYSNCVSKDPHLSCNSLLIFWPVGYEHLQADRVSELNSLSQFESWMNHLGLFPKSIVSLDHRNKWYQYAYSAFGKCSPGLRFWKS